MPKLGVFSGTAVCAKMAAEGFAPVRQRVSHVIMQRKLAGVTTTIPVPNHRTLHIGTLQAIIRQSGIARAQFMR